MRERKTLVQTIERVAMIFEAMGRSPRGMGIGELARALKLPKGTVHRLVSSLAHFGLLYQDQKTKNYFLGLKLLELGNLVGAQLDFRKVAEPLLRDLAETTRETVHMVIMDRGEVIYIEKIESEENSSGLKMASRVGLRGPAHSCAVGKVLLSYLAEEQLREFLEKKELVRKTARTITDPEELRKELTLIRTQGYAIDDEENEEGIRCLGAPIFAAKGEPIAAISVSGPAFRVTKSAVRDRIKKNLLQTASRISARLGFNGTTGKEANNEEDGSTDAARRGVRTGRKGAA